MSLRRLSLAAVAPALLPASLLAQEAGPATDRTYDRIKPSVLTIQVHSGDAEARGSLGSGYVVSADGRVATNYHVVGAFVDEPGRYTIRARDAAGERPAILLAFDIANDLALLRVDGLQAPPLSLAREVPPPGSAIVSFGNPQGLGLSLIEGIFNGFAEKGFVDRMLLSMPLNAGMSGGPILNQRSEVVGTNVSVMWLQNSLSFGVPAAKLRPLLDSAPLALTRDALRKETHRQLVALEQDAVNRVIAPLAADGDSARTTVGAAELRRPPELFDCWNNMQVFKDEGVTKISYGCNLQFTPSVESLGEVGSVELLVEHFASTRAGRWGFYAALSDHPGSHHEVEPRDPRNGVLSAPECVAERSRAGSLTWKVHTCLNAFVKHPGLFNFDLVATSVSRPDAAVFVGLHLRGFRFESFKSVAQGLLTGISLGAAR
ncbi:MAG TPA: serine protease [Solirubrobacterales bacterium]|nr:serine protease [Solirubrobacterales bacterium]